MKFRLILSLSVVGFLAGSVAWAGQPTSSAKIDELLETHWKEKGVEPLALASDEVFLRRIYLDVAGRIPSAEEAEEFLNDDRPGKREELVDRLLGADAFVEHFYNFWADILRVNENLGGGQNIVPAYVSWLRDSLNEFQAV